MSTDARAERGHRRPYAPRMAAAARREQLLDAALAVIVEHGYGHVSIEAIARAAGVTRPVIYGQFSGLRDLLEQLIEREEHESLAQLDDLLPEHPDARPPAEVLAESVRRFLDVVASRPETWTLILSPLEGTPEVVRQHVRSHRRRMLERTEAVVEWAITRSPPADVRARHDADHATTAGIDIELAARAILGLAEDAGRMVLSDRDRYSPDRYERFVARLMSLVWR